MVQVCHCSECSADDRCRVMSAESFEPMRFLPGNSLSSQRNRRKLHSNLQNQVNTNRTSQGACRMLRHIIRGTVRGFFCSSPSSTTDLLNTFFFREGPIFVRFRTRSPPAYEHGARRPQRCEYSMDRWLLRAIRPRRCVQQSKT